MRQLRRTSVPLPTLSPEGAGGKLKAVHIQKYDQDGSRPLTTPSYWTNPDVLGALCAMQGRVCAYCGADIEETGRDVDHFRPKKRVRGEVAHGGYWWLVYEYENYFLTCTVCNQKCKGDQFPLEVGATRIGYEDRQRLVEEGRILANPALDPVEDWIKVDWQEPSCSLRASDALPPEVASRVSKFLTLLRVNFKVTQRRKRGEIQRLVIEKLAAGKAEEVRLLAIRYRPHSIVAKQILEANAPHVLPTPDEELAWLLENLKSELLDKLEDLNDPAATETDENEAKELMWALAILWRDPPVGPPEAIRDFLERNGLRDYIEEYLRKLQPAGTTVRAD